MLIIRFSRLVMFLISFIMLQLFTVSEELKDHIITTGGTCWKINNESIDIPFRIFNTGIKNLKSFNSLSEEKLSNEIKIIVEIATEKFNQLFGYPKNWLVTEITIKLAGPIEHKNDNYEYQYYFYEIAFRNNNSISDKITFVLLPNGIILNNYTGADEIKNLVSREISPGEEKDILLYKDNTSSFLKYQIPYELTGKQFYIVKVIKNNLIDNEYSPINKILPLTIKEATQNALKSLFNNKDKISIANNLTEKDFIPNIFMIKRYPFTNMWFFVIGFNMPKLHLSPIPSIHVPVLFNGNVCELEKVDIDNYCTNPSRL